MLGGWNGGEHTFHFNQIDGGVIVDSIGRSPDTHCLCWRIIGIGGRRPTDVFSDLNSTLENEAQQTQTHQPLPRPTAPSRHGMLCPFHLGPVSKGAGRTSQTRYIHIFFRPAHLGPLGTGAVELYGGCRKRGVGPAGSVYDVYSSQRPCQF